MTWSRGSRASRSLGRLGLLIHSTAGFVDAGWDGHLTLELSNVANLPIAIYPGMKIGQISFLQMTTEAETPYGSEATGSKYRGQKGPTPSRYYLTSASESLPAHGGSSPGHSQGALPGLGTRDLNSTPIMGIEGGRPRLDPSLVANVAKPRGRPRSGLHVCPECTSHLTQPTCWEQTPKRGALAAVAALPRVRVARRRRPRRGRDRRLRRAPRLRHARAGRGAADLRAGNMRAFLETFTSALDAGLICPEDF